MKEKIEDVLIMGALIVMVLGVFIVLFEGFGGADWLIRQAEAAATANTTVTVVITDEVSSATVSAEVPCNEVNCPVVVEPEPEPTLWQRFTAWFAGLW